MCIPGDTGTVDPKVRLAEFIDKGMLLNFI